MTGDEPDDYLAAATGGDGDEVACRVCGRPFGRITQSHLDMHGMKLDDYREEYPDAPVVSESVRWRSGVKEHDDETKEQISEAIREKHESGEYS